MRRPSAAGPPPAKPLASRKMMRRPPTREPVVRHVVLDQPVPGVGGEGAREVIVLQARGGGGEKGKGREASVIAAPPSSGRGVPRPRCRSSVGPLASASRPGAPPRPQPPHKTHPHVQRDQPPAVHHPVHRPAQPVARDVQHLQRRRAPAGPQAAQLARQRACQLVIFHIELRQLRQRRERGRDRARQAWGRGERECRKRERAAPASRPRPRPRPLPAARARSPSQN
jgi:hypothetical protein